MAAVFLAPGVFGAGGQFMDQNGVPLALGQITTYLAGTSTPAATFTTSAGTIANANPIILNPDGRPPQEIWFQAGVAMKLVLADALGSIIATYDNLTGMNDLAFAQSEWVALGLTPTQLNSTQFSVPGNATGILHADRRIQTLNGGGTLYGAVVSSVFGGGVTTVTVRNDTGQALDSGLSSVLYGFASAFPGNTSIPMADTNPITGTTDATKRTMINSDRITTGQTRNLVMQDADYDIGDPGVCQARLTFTQGSAFPTADVLAATAIFLQPVRGTRIALFDTLALKWNIVPFTQAVTVAVPGTTSQMYDVFASQAAGVVSLNVVAWTNDTTRATGLATQDGVLVNAAALNQRYMGSFRTTGVAGQSEDSIAKRYLWNYYNRALRKMLVTETTVSWAYTLAAYRQANANAANQLDFVVGVQENPVKANVWGTASNSGAGATMTVGVGLDSTTVNSADTYPLNTISTNPTVVTAQLEVFTGIGRHILAWLEASQASGTTTWWGLNAGALAQSKAGIGGELWG
jgi:hypothetical protein